MVIYGAGGSRGSAARGMCDGRKVNGVDIHVGWLVGQLTSRRAKRQAPTASGSTIQSASVVPTCAHSVALKE
jgi:hypothetical protein